MAEQTKKGEVYTTVSAFQKYFQKLPQRRVYGINITFYWAVAAVLFLIVIFGAAYLLAISDLNTKKTSNQQTTATTSAEIERIKKIQEATPSARPMFPFSGELVEVEAKKRILKIKENITSKIYIVVVDKNAQQIDVTAKKYFKLSDLKVGNQINVVTREDFKGKTKVTTDLIYLVPEFTPPPPDL